MNFKKNPFYILKIACTAGRRDIVSAAEEMSFISDSETCADAQNELINANKRLGAELDWFIDLSKAESQSIIECIDNDEPISTDGLSALSRLNATLYNFSLVKETDPFELGYALLDIDEQFSSIESFELAEQINDNRKLAGIALVQENDVLSELNRKRDGIRQLISEKLDVLDEESYIELVTMLAEKCIAQEDYDDGVILSDIIDQYELKLQSKIEALSSEIYNHIERIKKLSESTGIEANLTGLLRRIKQWDTLVQPLQLKSQASGLPHENSEKLGFALRDLAIYLHNEKGMTNEALKFVEEMQDVFAEIGTLSDLFESDSDILSDLLQGEKDANEVLAELEAINKMSESLKTYATSSSVDNYIDKVRKLNARLKSLNLDSETKTKVRENLCLMARGTAIELHNSKHQTLYALNIAKALVSEFGDLSSLSSKLTQDSVTLNQQLLLSNRGNTYAPSSSSSSKRNPGCLITIIIAIVVAVIIAIASSSGSGSSSSSSSSPSYSSSSSSSSSSPSSSAPSSSTSTEVRFSSNATSGDKVYADIVSIFPEIGIYTEGSTNYSYFVCSCKTSSGSTVWVYMTTSEYKSNFDSSASTSIFTEYAEEVTYSSAKRIHGTAKRAESVMSGLSVDTGSMLIDFSSLK